MSRRSRREGCNKHTWESYIVSISPPPPGPDGGPLLAYFVSAHYEQPTWFSRQVVGMALYERRLYSTHSNAPTSSCICGTEDGVDGERQRYCSPMFFYEDTLEVYPSGSYDADDDEAELFVGFEVPEGKYLREMHKSIVARYKDAQQLRKEAAEEAAGKGE